MSNKQVPNDVSMMSINVEAQPPNPPYGDQDAVSTKEKSEGMKEVPWNKMFGMKEVPWNKMFVIACVIAVSLDPLFFYIPIIDEKEKCLAEDKELRTIALILRSLTDVTFVVNIIYHVCEAINTAYKKEHKGKKSKLSSDWELPKIISFAKLVAGKLAWRSTLTSILAVFPLPQLLLVFVFFKMRGHGYLQLNVFLLAQYLPRIYRIYLSCQKLRQTTGIWVKALFNFFLYILASHVLGAFWYFFSIQRETSCWHRACVDHSTNVEGCMSTLYCRVHNNTARNATFLNQFCLISAEENAKAPFDYGIFLDSLKNGITGDANFGTKLSYSFWWGLRNLSNFGTNLQTSTYVWETCFAVLISITGLLLFLYLIGNVQTFISMEAERWEHIRKKIELNEKDIAGWMDRNKLPDNLKTKIRKGIQQKLEENKDTNLENLFSILPRRTQKEIKRFLGLKLLKKVPKLERLDKKSILKKMCHKLQPVMYDEGTEVFRMRDPLHRMLLITEGTLLTYKTPSDDCHDATENAETDSISSSLPVGHLHKRDFYGAEELIDWVTQKKDLGHLPASCFNVKCGSKVEGFVLMAKDLRSVVSKNESKWIFGISRSEDSIV